jgi:hypothetical protein
MALRPAARLHPWCCGNTSWSSFSWRAKASPNVPFSAAAVASGAAAAKVIHPRPKQETAPNSTECAKHMGSLFDCFTFAVNTTDKTQGSGAAVPADEWTDWHLFDPQGAW